MFFWAMSITLLFPGNGEGGAAASVTPLWTLNVGVLGYSAPGVHENGPFSLPPMEPLCFLNNNEVAVTFTTRTVPDSIARRGDTESLPLLLNALFVDSRTGQVRAMQDWPTASDRARITPVQGQGFVVITPDLVTLYSSNIERMKEIPLQLSRDPSADIHSFRPQASPAGRYLMIGYAFKNGVQDGYIWIDLVNLRVLKRWDYVDLSQRHTGAVSDEGTAINSHRGSGNSIGIPGTDPANSPCPSDNGNCLRGIFVSGDRLFSSRPPDRIRNFSIRLIRTDATAIFDLELANGEVMDPYYPVVGGGRFAIAIYKGRGGSESLDIAPHFELKEIRVYDSEDGREVYALDGKSQKIKSVSAFALSGDGSLLALIDQDGFLRLYRIS